MVAEHDAGLVEGEVVIGELAQIGEAGRDLARSARPGRHQAPDLLPDRLGNLSPGAPWPKPREAKRRRYRLDIGRQRRRTTAGGLVKKALSEDEEALRTMRRHRYPLLLPDPSPRGNDEPIRILEDQTPIGWGRRQGRRSNTCSSQLQLDLLAPEEDADVASHRADDAHGVCRTR